MKARSGSRAGVGASVHLHVGEVEGRLQLSPGLDAARGPGQDGEAAYSPLGGTRVVGTLGSRQWRQQLCQLSENRSSGALSLPRGLCRVGAIRTAYGR